MRVVRIIMMVVVLAMVGCGQAPAEDVDEENDEQLTLPNLDAVEGRPTVVATTTVIGDVVAAVGGEAIDLEVLMAPGQDPHTYEASAQDIVAMENADVVFANGWGFEEGLEESLDQLDHVVPLSAGIDAREFSEDDHEDEEEHEGEDDHADEGEGDHEDEEEHEDDHDHGSFDPHVWLDPANIDQWVTNTVTALSSLDPDNAATYEANAEVYQAELSELQDYIAQQLETVPQEQRQLVTNHDSLGYFAEAYGFDVIGTVVPGVTTSIEPSSRDLAELVETLRETQVDAIFVETTASDELAAVVADELGYPVDVYTLYTGAVGEPGSGAETYIGMMRANIDVIVTALSD